MTRMFYITYQPSTPDSYTIGSEPTLQCVYAMSVWFVFRLCTVCVDVCGVYVQCMGEFLLSLYILYLSYIYPISIRFIPYISPYISLLILSYLYISLYHHIYPYLSLFILIFPYISLCILRSPYTCYYININHCTYTYTIRIPYLYL